MLDTTCKALFVNKRKGKSKKLFIDRESIQRIAKPSRYTNTWSSLYKQQTMLITADVGNTIVCAWKCLGKQRACIEERSYQVLYLNLKERKTNKAINLFNS